MENIDLTGIVPNNKYDESFELSNLPELNLRLEQIMKTSEDFVVPTAGMMTPDGKRIGFNHPETHAWVEYDMSPNFKNQMADKLKIPSRYWDRMEQANYYPLLKDNINTWLMDKGIATEEGKEARYNMVRTVAGEARGLLSNRYAVMDSYDLALETMKTVMEINSTRPRDERIMFVKADLTEESMYVKALDYGKPHEIKGEIHHAGMVIKNNEYGKGTLSVALMMWRQVCANGMIREASLKEFHIGKPLKAGVYTQKTRSLLGRAWLSEVHDEIIGSMSNNIGIDEWVKELNDAAKTDIDPAKAIKKMTNEHIFSELEANSIIAAMMADQTAAPNTVYHLANGITAMAKETNTERRIELETFAGNTPQMIAMVA